MLKNSAARYFMRKLLILVLIILVTGCAQRQTVKYVPYAGAEDLYHPLLSISAKILPVIDKENMKQYRIAVIDSPEIYAFTQCDDNKIVIVSTGTLRLFTYNEMHFIMAHEYSHIVFKHCTSRKAVSLTTNLLNVIPNFGGLLNLILNPIITNAYSREQEYEADAKAAEVLLQIGISKQIAIDSLEKLRTIAAQKDISDADRTGLFDTHPNLTARIEAIRKQSASGGAPE